MTVALLTDLYQLTMLQAYFDQRMNATASFEFFVRKLPTQRNFLVAAGLEQVLDELEGLRFSPEEIAWLAQTRRFRPDFLESLEGLRFTGDVWAMTEGTVFFPDEPILRVTAPMREAQLVESRVINLLNFETMVASKAARCVAAAPGKLLVDFGLRRAHGAEAGLLSARASYLAGFSGTATVLAGMRFGIPIHGTMAHSFVQAHDDEEQAFENFARSQPDNATLLIDTYDTEVAAGKVVRLAAKLSRDGIRIRAVRIDSGDLGERARQVRQILDAGGQQGIAILASGNLDEYQLQGLLRAGAPIAGFGVGTRMNTSADAPSLDCAYKLTEYAGVARRKRSEGKTTWPGRKQVFRRQGAHGELAGDLLTLQDELAEGTALLQPVLVAGKRAAARPSLESLRGHAQRQLAALPAHLRALEPATTRYPVAVSASLRSLAQAVDARTRAGADTVGASAIGAGDALIVVDVQNDFLPGGALAVPAGDRVLPVLTQWLDRFAQQDLPVFATRDWHPRDHCSFQARGGPWPPHCVAGTIGADFPPRLRLPESAQVVSKATDRDKDAYSGFAGTDLAQRLRAAGARRLFVGGLATDYCVLQTVKDALGEGLAVVLLLDAIRAVDLSPGDGEAAIAQMLEQGAQPLREVDPQRPPSP